ncbi:MAG: HD domain-containing protein [Spirochaetaceae bacterium]|jgi:GTP pyrophosphokinase|nr:HD domain-containing protein [Spirochaetaceae bacterium]
MKWESVLERIDPLSDYDKERIKKALNAAKDTGYAEGIGAIVLKLGMEVDCAVAAMLLAVPECSGVLLEEDWYSQAKEISREYGETVAALNLGLKKISRVHSTGKTAAEAESIRKMLFALVNDVRVLFIKLADRLQTLRGARWMDSGFQKEIAQECLGIYAPLAGRFGVSWIKDEIEDLSLKYLNREIYGRIKNIVALKKNERQHILEMIVERIKEEAAKNNLHVEVSSRAKHFYSIYQKMRQRNKNAEDIFDFFGIRILCDNIEACYTILGIIHGIWRPFENRFKDYIAKPKLNGYQSLHTTVITDSDESSSEAYTEVQIRTFEMHDVAEHGIASHWLYKKGAAAEIVNEKYLPVINKLKDCLKDSSEEFLAEVKKELFQNSVFVFTPQGKVVELPAGATPLDFAYSIHQAIGEHCSFAKADGKIVPLNRPLKNTQVVEIVTSQASHPHENWLERVKTSKALNKIRHWLSLHDVPALEKNVPAEKITARNGHTAASEKNSTPEKSPFLHNSPRTPVCIRVQHEKNFLVSFAHCCNPMPGDPITGFVSRGRGIIVHKKNCNSLKYIKEFEQRRVDAEWDYETS